MAYVILVEESAEIHALSYDARELPQGLVAVEVTKEECDAIRFHGRPLVYIDGKAREATEQELAVCSEARARLDEARERAEARARLQADPAFYAILEVVRGVVNEHRGKQGLPALCCNGIKALACEHLK